MRLPHSGSMRVDRADGSFKYVVKDLDIPCRGGMRLLLMRYYDSLAVHRSNAIAGYLDGWSFNFDERLRFEYRGSRENFSPLPGQEYSLYPNADPNDPSVTLFAISIITPDRKTLRYTRSDNVYTAVDAANMSTLVQNVNGTFSAVKPGRWTHVYRPDGRLQSISDTFGNTINYSWAINPVDPTLIYMSAITDPAGRVITASLTPTGGNTLTYKFTDWAGRNLTYRYQLTTGEPTTLLGFIDSDGNLTTYTYWSNTLPADPIPDGLPIPGGIPSPLTYIQGLAKITFPNGTFVVNYAAGGRPIWKRVGIQIFGGRLVRNNVYTDSSVTSYVDGQATVNELDDNGSIVSSTDPLGNSFNYNYDSQGMMKQAIDPRLGVRTYEYGSDGRLSQLTDPLGTTRSWAYHPTFNFPTDITVPGPTPQTYSRTYDPVTGAVLTDTDPLGQVTRYEYDSYGHRTAIIDHRGKKTKWTFDPTTGQLLTTTDALGNITSYAYDSLGRQISKTTPEGRTTRYAYNNSNLMTSITDPAGNTSTMQYDGNRNLVAFTDALGNVRRCEYNVLNEQTRLIDALGNATVYTYTNKGEIATITDPLGRVATFEYDANGRVIRSVDPLGQVTTTSYDGSCGTSSVTDPLGRTTAIARDLRCRITERTLADGSRVLTIYNPDSTVQSMTDPKGNVTTFITDALRRVIKSIDPIGRTTSIAYDANSNVKSFTDGRGNTTSFQYNARNEMIGVTRRDGSTISFNYSADGFRTSTVDARGEVWTTTYDANGRPVATTDPLGNTGTTVYDALGRAVQAITPLGRTASMSYDAISRLVAAVDPMGNTSSRVYDAVSNLRSATDPLGRTVHLVYDELNRVVQAVDPAGSITSKTYDAGGRVTAITDANGNITSYEFDVRNRVTAEIYPDGSRLAYAWDANSNLLSKSDPRGFKTTYAYDPANQLTSVTLPDSTQVTLFYDLNGNITQRNDVTGTYEFAYDAENRPTRIVQNGAAYQISYDPDGRRLSVTFPDQRVSSMAYDAAGRAASVSTPDLGNTALSYDADSRRVAISYANGTSSLAAYDLNSRLVRLVHKDSGGANITPDFRMSYDAVGNMLAVNDAATPMWSYSYDVLDRLTRAIDQGASSTSSWTYDRLGNRLTSTVDGTTTAYSYNNLNQLVKMGDTVLFWDSNGNLAQKVEPSGATRYLFDSRDRLVEVGLPTNQLIQYGYDQQGRMITRTDPVGTTSFEWNGWDLEREIDAAGHVTRYFYNGSEMVGFARDDQHYRVHSDWLSSVRSVTDQAGNIVFEASYGPWGEQSAVSDSVPNGGLALRWVGGRGVRWDVDVALYYMRNRFYSNSIGRFISRDRIRLVNRYVYANDRPVRMIDPSGLLSTVGDSPSALFTTLLSQISSLAVTDVSGRPSTMGALLASVNVHLVTADDQVFFGAYGGGDPTKTPPGPPTPDHLQWIDLADLESLYGVSHDLAAAKLAHELMEAYLLSSNKSTPYSTAHAAGIATENSYLGWVKSPLRRGVDKAKCITVHYASGQTVTYDAVLTSYGPSLTLESFIQYQTSAGKILLPTEEFHLVDLPVGAIGDTQNLPGGPGK